MHQLYTNLPLIEENELFESLQKAPFRYNFYNDINQ